MNGSITLKSGDVATTSRARPATALSLLPRPVRDVACYSRVQGSVSREGRLGSEVVSGIVKAWGRILAGLHPNLSIEITRECPLRCPGCYAYGADHLGGDITCAKSATTRAKRSSPSSAPRSRAPPASPLDRRRRAAGPLSRAERAPAEARRARASTRSSSRARCARSRSSGPRIPPPADRRVDRRPPARARRAPEAGDLRSHPEAHQGTQDHRPLHGDAAAGAPRRLPRRVRRLLVEQSRTPARSGSASTRRRSARSSDERLLPADRERVVADLIALRKKYPKLQMPKGLIEVYATPPDSPDECIFAQTTTCVSADLKTQITPVPVRRQPRLLAVRLHRLGRAEGGGAPPAQGRHPGGRDLRGRRKKSARAVRALREPAWTRTG